MGTAAWDSENGSNEEGSYEEAKKVEQSRKARAVPKPGRKTGMFFCLLLCCLLPAGFAVGIYYIVKHRKNQKRKASAASAANGAGSPSASPSWTPSASPSRSPSASPSWSPSTSPSRSPSSVVAGAGAAKSIFISELPFPTGSSQSVEVAAPYGMDVSGHVVDFYEEDGAIYQSEPMTDFVQGATAGGLTFWSKEVDTTRNSPIGVALADTEAAGGQEGVAEFISYGGTIVATDGVASGLSSSNIVPPETTGDFTTLIGYSLQKGGVGCDADDFLWQVSSFASSPGSNNEGMSVTCGGIDMTAPPVSSLTVAPASSPTMAPANSPTMAPSAGPTIAATSRDIAKGSMFISELHYDNEGKDEGQFVEIAAPSGTDVLGVFVDFYKSDGELYQSKNAVDFTQGSTSGGLTFYSLRLDSLRNGAPHGIALADLTDVLDGNGGSIEVLEFLSYGGTIVGTEGFAKGLTSVDIGVEQETESNPTPVGYSLQKGGEGCSGDEFEWQPESLEETPGDVNVGMTVTCEGI